MNGVSLDWAVPSLNYSGNANPNTLEGSGIILEVTRYDSLYNAEGERIVLPTGQSYRSNKKRASDYEKAIVVTKIWTRSNSVEYTKIEIRSPHMKAALKSTIPAYQNIEIGIDHIWIKDQPRCLFHYRDELQVYGMNMESTNLEAARHVHFLLSYMWDLFVPESISFFSTVVLVASVPPSLEFDYLWMIFRPGDLVYVPKNKGINRSHDTAFIFEEMTMKNETWSLTGYRIDYYHRQFGYIKETYTIRNYPGLRALQDLPVVPVQYVPGFYNIQERLVSRGKLFTTLHEQHYYWYEGPSDILQRAARWSAEEYDGEERYQFRVSRAEYRSKVTKGRIMIDQDAYIEVNKDRDGFVQSKAVFHADDGSTVKMNENELMACSGTVAGYSFKDNEWGKFQLDNLTNIDLDSVAFDSLLLTNDYKQQILSLVQVHEDERLKFDDLIKGKGKGMVFLFYGEPGTGKTLTAESIADHCQKPLLRLDAGTLGTTVESVEKQLSTAFYLAESWHAVVLIDEADIFLEQRKSKNLTHNGLVSVFLRMLEYYQGILILTTNRIGAIDVAFKSRIHLAIRYPPLSRSSRLQLWQTFLLRACPDAAIEMGSNGMLESLAAEELNGRQIKNLVRTASALAISDKEAQGKVLLRHIHSALRPMKAFEAEVSEKILQQEQNDDLEHQRPPTKRRRVDNPQQ